MKTPLRRACITGASSGIGAAFARALALRGYELEIVARSTDRLAALAQELEDDHAVHCRTTTCDLTDAAQALALARRLREEPPDLLINNAGVGLYCEFAKSQLETQLAHIDLNVRALVQLSHAYVSGALERKSGNLVQIASTVAYMPVPYTAVYAATKAFVLHFGEALWEELRGSGVRVLTVCPGFTQSRFAATAGMPGVVQWGRPAAPADVVETALAALEGDAPSVVHGFWNRVGGTLARGVPRRVLLRVLGSWSRRGLVDRPETI